ncbi:MAG TPA: hypothetical protein VHX37_07140 [Acidobacteriaceae bacterium]|jgi:hypothetical protein|nr:hypothetical protein [Acidobacteriaceae bacterium]
MHFSALEKADWLAASIASAALLFVMLGRGRWREFPVLTTWLAYLTTRALLLMAAYGLNSWYWYAHIFWTGLWIDFGFQLAVVIEIARIVLRPTGTWVRDARIRFAAAGFAGAIAAGLIVWWITPPSSIRQISWQIRGNLFTSLVICELFVVMSMTANRLGLGWRNHVMAVGQGLMAWCCLMVLKTAVQSLPGNGHLYRALEQARAITYTAAIFWMAVRLWFPEPERQPIDPELQQYILALHRRVEYDLRRLDAGS